LVNKSEVFHFFAHFEHFWNNYISAVDSLERVFVALGSNVPPRWVNLFSGRDMLRRISSGGWMESPVYETPPVGPAGQGPYFNQVVSFMYSGTPKRLLNYLKGAEILLGRKDRGHWNSREIDLDLLYYGKFVQAGRPCIPHPELDRRQFVLVPLNDIAPDWVDSLSGCTVNSLLQTLLAREEKIPFRKITEVEP
jgi:2-amino-4-hydroxy-6-hydroxymethyldihydropteridine diphosphokinase